MLGENFPKAHKWSYTTKGSSGPIHANHKAEEHLMRQTYRLNGQQMLSDLTTCNGRGCTNPESNMLKKSV